MREERWPGRGGAKRAMVVTLDAEGVYKNKLSLMTLTSAIKSTEMQHRTQALPFA